MRLLLMIALLMPVLCNSAEEAAQQAITVDEQAIIAAFKESDRHMAKARIAHHASYFYGVQKGIYQEKKIEIQRNRKDNPHADNQLKVLDQAIANATKLMASKKAEAAAALAEAEKALSGLEHDPLTLVALPPPGKRLTTPPVFPANNDREMPLDAEGNPVGGIAGLLESARIDEREYAQLIAMSETDRVNPSNNVPANSPGIDWGKSWVLGTAEYNEKKAIERPIAERMQYVARKMWEKRQLARILRYPCLECIKHNIRP